MGVEKYIKCINFDLDTKQLLKIFPNGTREPYALIKKFFPNTNTQNLQNTQKESTSNTQIPQSNQINTPQSHKPKSRRR